MKRFFWFLLAVIVAAAFISCSRTEKGAAGGGADAAPSFILTSLNNEKVSLDDYRGKVVMVEFFASWCPPCQMFAPELKSIYEKYRNRGFVVLGVSIDDGPTAPAAVSGFMKTFGLSYPVMIDDGTVSKKYQVISIPTSVIIDKEGKLKSKHIGLRPDFANTLTKEIEALL